MEKVPKPKVTVRVKSLEKILANRISTGTVDVETKMQIAKRGGLSYPYVLDLLESRRNPSIEVLVRYMVGMGLATSEIRMMALGDVLDIMVE